MVRWYYTNDKTSSRLLSHIFCGVFLVCVCVCIQIILKVLGDYQKVIVQWPSILSLIFLLGRFIYILVKDVRIHLHLEEEVSTIIFNTHVRACQRTAVSHNERLLQEPEELMERHQLQYVRDLLRKKPAHR